MADALGRKLEPGRYKVAVVQDDPDTYVGRGPKEDASTMPKPVYNLNLRGGRDPGLFGTWEVLKNSDGTYELKVGNVPTGPYKEQVYVWVDTAKWDITPATTTTGKHGYIIELQLDGKRVGWSANGVNIDGKEIPIFLTPLTSTKSVPPQYDPTDVFVFEKFVL